MRTKKIITAALLVAGLLFGNNFRAQTNSSTNSLTADKSSYKTAFGLRAGETSGLTVKHFFSSANAGECIIGLWPNAISLTGLYEHYVNAGTSGLNWYYGGGAHFASQTMRTYYMIEGSRYYRYGDNDPGIGIDGVLGIEYKIPKIPFAFNVDMKPFIEMNSGGNAFFSLDPGVGIKVVF